MAYVDDYKAALAALEALHAAGSAERGPGWADAVTAAMGAGQAKFDALGQALPDPPMHGAQRDSLTAKWESAVIRWTGQLPP